jgi:hypothetical protein
MPIKIIVCLCLLVFAACSVDSEDPQSGDITSTEDATTQDVDSTDTHEVCDPFKSSTTCPCDPQIYDPDPVYGYRCCYGYMIGYSCVGNSTAAGWRTDSYEQNDPCPVDEYPQCPFE